MSGFNPNIQPGNLNRLRASVIVPEFPALTITSPFLTKEGIGIAFRGDATVQIDVMTGIVTSPEPFLGVTVTAHLIKSLFLAQGWRTQLELLSLLGPCTVRPDTSAMQPYNFFNCSILRPGDQGFNGTAADYTVQIGGVYQVNAQLFNA